MFPKEEVEHRVAVKMSEGESDKEEGAEELHKNITDGLKKRAKHYKITKPFAEKDPITRRDLLLLAECVRNYDALKVIDEKLMVDHVKWLAVCGKSAEDLNNEDHNFSPKNFDILMDQYCETSDKVEAQFEKILEQFPDKTEVIAHLTRFRAPGNINNPGYQDDLVSTLSGKGGEYAKQKLPAIMEDVTNEFITIQNEYNLGEGSTVQVETQLQSLDRMFKILDVDGKFDKLVRELEECEDSSNDDVKKFETWQKEFVVKVGALKSNFEARTKSAVDSSKSSFSTHFKKMDLPKFSGDCLDYIEWKTKWKSSVSTCGMVADFELARIKENVPEQARKKLFDVKFLNKAWQILDEYYGNQKLITQKIKNRMKSLKPKSTEPHEVVIELNEEVDYLVKRLVGLKAQDLLNTDNDYINAIYAHLPYEQQLAWDDYEVKEEETEWLAFSEFLNSKYKSALKKRTRVESLKEMKIDVEKVKVKCHICNEEGHKSFKCPKNPKT